MGEFDALFYQDAYCRQFRGTVVSCVPYKKKYAVELTETAFYPEGGGQPGDTGTLNDIPVCDTRKLDGHIVHIVDTPMNPGTAVEGTVSWERRLDHMVMHTAEHMVSGLIHRTFGYDNVGFHMGEDAVVIDFDGPMDWNACMEIEAKANALVRRNLPVEVSIPSQEELSRIDYRSKKELSGEVRIVTVPEADVCACCGTHLHYTGEIGYIKLISAEKHKNGVRIEMLAGQRAENYMRRIMDQNSEVSHLLSAKVFETGAAVEKLLQASFETRQKLRILSERAMAAAAEQLPEGEAVQIAFAEDADHDGLRHFANLIMEKKKPAAAAALCADEKECRYVMISSSIPLRKGIREINQALNGRGGGNDEMVQGMFHAPKEEIVKILEQQLKALM